MVDKEPKIIHFPGLDQEDTSAPAGKQAAEAPQHEPSSSKKAYQVADDGSDDPFSDEVKSAVHEQEKEDERKLLAIELPTALADREIKLYLAAIVSALLGVVMSISLMSPQFLILLAFSAFFIYTGISSRLDFRDGKIVELSLLCYNVQKTARISSDYYVSFCTSDEVPTYYRFLVRDKKGEFFPGCPYLVYYHQRNPGQLLAYYQL